MNRKPLGFGGLIRRFICGCCAGTFIVSGLLTAPSVLAVETAPGVTATEIKIGQTMPYSGPASSFGTIGRSEAAYFKTINEQGGINGRKINLISLDDAFSPPKTVEQTRRLVEQEGVAFIFQPLGGPTGVAVRKYLNDRKIPQLFVGTGTTSFGDYQHYPWSIGWQPTFASKSKLYAVWLLKNKPHAKVATLSQNNDAGRDYMDGFKAALAGQNGVQIVYDATYEVTDPTLDQQLTGAQQSGADVFYILGGAPKNAAMAIRRVFEFGWHPTFFLSSTGSSIATGIRPAGFEKAQGIMSMQYLKDPSDPEFANDPALKAYREWMGKDYPAGDPIDFTNVYGYSVAQTLVEVLKQCGNDLSRENIMRQATNLDIELPLLLPNGRVHTTPTDRYPVKSARMVRFEGNHWVVLRE